MGRGTPHFLAQYQYLITLAHQSFSPKTAAAAGAPHSAAAPPVWRRWRSTPSPTAAPQRTLRTTGWQVFDGAPGSLCDPAAMAIVIGAVRGVQAGQRASGQPAPSLSGPGHVDVPPGLRQSPPEFVRPPNPNLGGKSMPAPHHQNHQLRSKPPNPRPTNGIPT